MNDRTTFRAPHNGETHVPLPPPDNPPDALPKAPTTGPRAKAYRDAVAKLVTWDHGKTGMDRLQMLKAMVKRIRAECEVEEQDIPVLIMRNARLNGVRPYTADEIAEAMDRRKTKGPTVEGEVPPLRGIRPNEVKTTSIEWFLPKVVAKGYYTMVSGRRGVGKSTFFTGMAALSPHTIWFCGEEGLKDMVVPRLSVHGIGANRVEFFTRDHNLTFPFCKAALMATVKAYKTELIIIDPLTAFLPATSDPNSNEEMQRVLQSLADVAEVMRVAMMVCLHPGKAAGNTIRGASVFNTHPRVIVELVKDDGPIPRRLMSNPKNNLAGEQPAREYYADAVQGTDIRRFRLGSSVSEADTLFAQEVTDRLERLIITDCEEWLKHILKDGPKLRKDIISQGKDEGYAPRTISRAGDKLGVLKDRAGFGEGTSWRLAEWSPTTPWDTPSE